jgi:hypothetical protein
MPRNAVIVIARFWVICFAFAFLPFGLPAVLAGVLTLPFLAFVALLVAVGFNFVQWLAHRAIFGGTEEYQQLRKSGLDPWFDSSCPWPFRSETEQLPLNDDEPAVRWFCRNCGAEAFDLEAPCRICGFEQFECPQCGSPVKDEFAACPRCGNDPLGQ